MADDTFAPSNSATQQPHIYRPVPRRSFPAQRIDIADSPTHDFTQETPPSATETRRSSDFLAQLNARLLRTYNSSNSEDEERERDGVGGLGLSSPRNKSFLNMTSSTLYGIYDEVDPNASSSAETPWGTGAETPAHTAMGYHAWDSGVGSPDGGLSMKTRARGGAQNGLSKERRKSMSPGRQKSGAWKTAVVGSKLAALWMFGVVYGLIVSHLHDTRQLAPVRMKVDKESWIYLASWGFAGVALGSLLPYVELTWGAPSTSSPTRTQQDEDEDDSDNSPESPISEQINDIVRSVAAFVGIAFAIRRLPWQSTLQLTLTLALVNPALWYILDRSKPGLSCSLLVTSILTSFIFLSNPDVLPSPPLPSTTNTTHAARPKSDIRRPMQTVGDDMFAGMVSYDNLAVVTWVGSVLFCSCVCFGSIGRRLAVLEEPGRRK